jgi:hypothetical protein
MNQTVYRDETGRPHREGGPAVVNNAGKLWFSQGRLHRADGPAVEGTQGTRMYAWRGVVIPKELIEDRNSLTVERALQESNSETQRIMLEIIGWDKLIEHRKTRILDQGEDGAMLFEFELPRSEEENIVLVKVIDATELDDGRRREYILRVPPQTRTVREAVAWTFDVHERDYEPVQEA